MVTGASGGRSQSRGKHSLCLPLSLSPCFSVYLSLLFILFWTPVLVFREWQTDLGTALTFGILHLRLLDMIVIWFSSLPFPLLSYSVIVFANYFLSVLLCSFTFARSDSQCLIPSLISTSLALHLPLLCSFAPCFSLSLCLSLSEVRHAALCICCVSFCTAYQISHRAPRLFLIALLLFFKFSNLSIWLNNP